MSLNLFLTFYSITVIFLAYYQTLALCNTGRYFTRFSNLPDYFTHLKAPKANKYNKLMMKYLSYCTLYYLISSNYSYITTYHIKFFMMRNPFKKIK